MRVLVTQAIDGAGLALLREAGLDVDLRTGSTPMQRDELLDRVQGCQALLCMPTDTIDEAVLQAGDLRIVANHAVGYDNVDLEAARQLGIVVTNTPGVLTDATADLAMALLLAVARRVLEGDRIMREGAFEGWRPLMLRGMELRDKRLGIVGLGRIGTAVAERAKAFGMEVVHTSRTSGLPLEELLATSDVVSLHCPLTEATHHLIDAEALDAMQASALLINTARGEVVDEGALVQALQEARIAGAGLDVYEREPACHPGLRDLDNVVLLPHLGSATHRARRQMATKAAQNIVAIQQGQDAPDRVS